MTPSWRFFGAPERHEDDALRSVLAALEMLDALAEFNEWQAQKGRSPFHIGIGINYGNVTVGNIGSERKMDYTVIGDMVNLASRLEGLTKKYREPIVISASVHRKVNADVRCRLLDKVSVKGRAAGTDIYTVRGALAPAEEKAWSLHEQALVRVLRAEVHERRGDVRRRPGASPGRPLCRPVPRALCRVRKITTPRRLAGH